MKTYNALFFITIFILSILLVACGGGDEAQAKRINSVTVTTTKSSPRVGDEIQLSAFVFYHDGTQEEITRISKWKSSADDLATITDTGLVKFLAKGPAEGKIKLTANFKKHSGSIEFYIDKPPIVAEINIDAFPRELIESQQIKLHATAILSNDDIIEDQSSFIWNSSNESIASISKNNNDEAILTTHSYGNVEITTSVNNKDLVSPLRINPRVVDLSLGAQTFYLNSESENTISVTATLSDDSNVDVTADVVWSYEPQDIFNNDAIEIRRDGEIEINSTGIIDVKAFYSSPVQSEPLEVQARIVIDKPLELFVVNDNHTGIEITWPKIYNSSNYTLYWNTQPIVNTELSESVIIKTNSFTHTPVDLNKKYFYRLTVTRDEIESDLSKELKVLPRLGRWKSRGMLPNLAVNSAHTMINNKFFVFGGQVINESSGELEATDEVWAYNFETNEWTNNYPPIIGAGAYHSASACSYENSIFIIGGSNNSNQETSKIHYIADINQWGTQQTFELDKSYSLINTTCALISEMIYLVGGTNNTTISNKIYSFPISSTDSNIILSEAGELQYKRFAHASTVIGGAIYIAGGNDGERTLNNMEIYNPANNSSSSYVLNYGRENFSLLANNNTLYAIGGINSEEFVDSIEFFNLDDHLWSLSETTPPYPSHSFSATLHDHTIHLFGGIKKHTVSDLNSNIQFDTLRNRWYPIANAPKQKASFATASVGDLIFLIGGEDNLGNILDSVESFNTAANNWSVVGNNFAYTDSMPTPRSEASAIGFTEGDDGKYIYIVGGRNDDGYLFSVDRYNVNNNLWYKNTTTPLPSLKDARANSCIVKYKKLLYTFGGNTEKPVRTYEQLNLQSNSWEILGNMDPPISGPGCTVIDDLIYIVGGAIYDEKTNDWKPTNLVQTYSPNTKIWNILPTLNTATIKPAIYSVNHRLYVTGGFEGSFSSPVAVSRTESFDRLSNRWSGSTSLELPISGMEQITASSFGNHIYFVLASKSIDTLETKSPSILILE